MTAIRTTQPDFRARSKDESISFTYRNRAAVESPADFGDLYTPGWPGIGGISSDIMTTESPIRIICLIPRESDEKNLF